MHGIKDQAFIIIIWPCPSGPLIGGQRNWISKNDLGYDAHIIFICVQNKCYELVTNSTVLYTVSLKKMSIDCLNDPIWLQTFHFLSEGDL